MTGIPQAASGSARPAALISGALRSPAVARLAILLGALLVWEIYARLFGDPAFVRPPTEVAAALVTRILSEASVRAAIVLTFWELAAAFTLSVAIGFPIGLIVGATRFTHRSLFPIVLLAYAIPQVTVLPLFVLIFGLGPASKIAFGASHGVFPIIVNVVAGLRNVNPLFMNSARSMGANRLQVLRRVVFPSLVPSFFTGMRLAMTMTLLGVLLAELYVSMAGIGYFTQLFSETFDPAPLFALIGVLTAMAVFLNEVVRRAELWYSRWRG